MNRKRILVRAEWTFWRSFASTWCLRKDEVVAARTFAQLSRAENLAPPEMGSAEPDGLVEVDELVSVSIETALATV